MTPKNIGTEELRKYCIENGLNFLDVLLEQKTVKKKFPRKKKVKSKIKRVDSPKPKSAEDIVLNTLDGTREILNDGEDISFYDFLGFVDVDLKNANQEIPVNCNLSGFVRDVLYSYAERVKFGKKPDQRRRLSTPVTAEELKKHLGIDFGEEGNNSIAGNLTPEEIRKNYPLNEQGMFRNKDGEYNIEGTKSWNGENKKKVRKELTDLVISHIVSKDKKERRTKIKYFERERNRLSEEINKTKTKEKQGPINITISASNPAPMFTFRKSFLQKRLRGKGSDSDLINQMDFVDANGKKINASFSNQKVYDYFCSKFNSFMSSKSTQGIKNVIKVKLERDDTNKSSRLLSELEGVEASIKTLKQNKPQISYLGLEGPNFSSLLEIVNAVKKNGADFRGYVPEYQYRLYNLMRSVVDSKITGALENVTVKNRNIDDLIFLDFARSDRFNVFSEDGEIFVGHEEDRLSLEDYHSLLHEIDKGGTRKGHLAKKYKITENFIDDASKRYKGKFDVVFLDYVSGVSAKRTKALETLFNRRLSDRSVVAVTSNMNPRVNHEVLVKAIPDYNLQKVFDLSEDYDMLIQDINDMMYQDGKAQMYFGIYTVEKK